MRLIDYTPKVFIIAHREDTAHLVAVLQNQGFDCEVLRQAHRPEQANFSRSYLCLQNHCNAWKWVQEHRLPAVVIEADFVPVKAFGQLPVPFDVNQADVGFSWLYTCASQVYDISPDGYAQGYSTSMVAYLLHPRCVDHLLAFAEQITQDPGPTAYTPWDSQLDEVLLAQELRNYIPFRNYGEHGSYNPNPEHKANGLSRTHRADVLYGPLAFEPMYAQVKGGWKVRLHARLKGLSRLAVGRYVRWVVLRRAEVPFKILRFALRRQLSFRI